MSVVTLWTGLLPPLELEDDTTVGNGELALLGMTLIPLQWLKKFLNCPDKVVLMASSPHSRMLWIRYGNTCSVNST